MSISLLYSPFPTHEEALACAKELVSQKLIACANIIDGATSIYQWEGELRQDSEVLLIAKTSDFKAQEVIAAIKKMHPYELPCILSFEAGAGFLPFLDWVMQQTTE